MKGKIVGLPKGYQAILPAEEKLEGSRGRAAIVIPRCYNAVQLESLCNRDCVVAQIKSNKGTLVLMSAYLDIKTDPEPDWLGEVVQYVDRKKYRLIIGIDTNAHSQLYGPTTNKRGEIVEEWILKHGLFVENIGRVPTFEIVRDGVLFRSCIDLTATKGDIEVVDWRVDQAYNASDHNTITWQVLESSPPPEPTRNWKKAKWKEFTEELVKVDPFIPEWISPKKLDKMVNKLYKAINAALDKACPLRARTAKVQACLLYTSPSPRDLSTSRMPSSA